MITTILAADLGKFNSVLCWFEPDSRKAEFRAVRSSSAKLRAELTYNPLHRSSSKRARRPDGFTICAKSGGRR